MFSLDDLTGFIFAQIIIPQNPNDDKFQEVKPLRSSVSQQLCAKWSATPRLIPGSMNTHGLPVTEDAVWWCKDPGH